MANNDGIFKHELDVIDNAKETIGRELTAVPSGTHQSLIKEYEKLLKTTRRLVKHNDRSEERLNVLANEAQEKTKQLEQLSAQLAKYLSPQVYESIFSGKQKVSLVSSRKKLTIFFSDLVGFTQITESLESEDLTAALNYYLEEMSTIALKYGATIDKYIGDAIMIFFGDPDSQGVAEDAIRCVTMATDMQQRLEELSETWGQFGLQAPFSMRIGINTGYCTVGNFGSENRMDYTVIGAGVNMASRLESAAESGTILLSYDTYNLIKDTIPCVEADRIKLKGRANPARTFRVLKDSDKGTVISIKTDNAQFHTVLSALSVDEASALKLSLEESLDTLNAHLDSEPKVAS